MGPDMGYSEHTDFERSDVIFFDIRRDFARFNASVSFDNAKVLKLGSMGDILGGLISARAARTIVADTADVWVEYGGEFPRLFKEKFERNERSLDLAKIEFHVADPMDLPYRDGLFDVAVSSYALNRIRDPFAALSEMLRVLKPGGAAHLLFDPVWTADTGSQYSHYVPQPWAHLLLNSDEFVKRMREAGASESEMSDFIHAPNRITSYAYQAGFEKVMAEARPKNFRIEFWAGTVAPNSLQLENLTKAAGALGCDPSDLLVRGFRVFAVK